MDKLALLSILFWLFLSPVFAEGGGGHNLGYPRRCQGELAEAVDLLADFFSLTLKEVPLGVAEFPPESTFCVKWGARNPAYSNPHLALEEARSKGKVILITNGRLDLNSLGLAPDEYILRVKEAANGLEVYILLISPTPEDQARWEKAFVYYGFRAFLNYFLCTYTDFERKLVFPDSETSQFRRLANPYADLLLFFALRTAKEIKVTVKDEEGNVLPCLEGDHYLFCYTGNPSVDHTVEVEGGKEGQVHFGRFYLPARFQLQEPQPGAVFFLGERVRVEVTVVGEKGLFVGKRPAWAEVILKYPSGLVKKVEEVGEYWFRVEGEAGKVFPRPTVEEVRVWPKGKVIVPDVLRIVAKVEHTGADEAHVFAQLWDNRGKKVAEVELTSDPHFPALYDGELSISEPGVYILKVYLVASYGRVVVGPIERRVKVEAIKVKPEIAKVRFQRQGEGLLVTVEVAWAESAVKLRVLAGAKGGEMLELERVGGGTYRGLLPLKERKVTVVLEGTLKGGEDFSLGRDYLKFLSWGIPFLWK